MDWTCNKDGEVTILYDILVGRT